MQVILLTRLAKSESFILLDGLLCIFKNWTNHRQGVEERKCPYKKSYQDSCTNNTTRSKENSAEKIFYIKSLLVNIVRCKQNL